MTVGAAINLGRPGGYHVINAPNARSVRGTLMHLVPYVPVVAEWWLSGRLKVARSQSEIRETQEP